MRTAKESKGKTVLKFLCRYWYNLGLIPGAIAAGVLALCWNSLDMLVKINLFSFIAIILHQFEEYGWPGGAPAMGNQMYCSGKMPAPMQKMLGSSDKPDRYPLNQLSALVTNCAATYGFYLLPVFFPDVIWLGLAPILFGFLQFMMHGVGGNVMLKKRYNPGLAAVVLGHIPIGIWYIHYITANGLATGFDWLIGFLYTMAFFVLVVGVLTYKVLADRNSKYPFAKEEMDRYHG